MLERVSFAILFICALEVIFWSLPVSTTAFSELESGKPLQLFQPYFDRENVNMSYFNYAEIFEAALNPEKCKDSVLSIPVLQQGEVDQWNLTNQTSKIDTCNRRDCPENQANNTHFTGDYAQRTEPEGEDSSSDPSPALNSTQIPRDYDYYGPSSHQPIDGQELSHEKSDAVVIQPLLCSAYHLISSFPPFNFLVFFVVFFALTLKNRKLVELLLHPTELYYVVVFYWRVKALKAKSKIDSTLDLENMNWCYDKLRQVSRSFSLVIMGLDKELADAICIFYLVLRGLDTVETKEDDMKPSVVAKRAELQKFHTHLQEKNWNIKGFGDKSEEIDLLERFDKVICSYQELSASNQQVISKICNEMQTGMSDFLDKDIDTVKDYDDYCYYVAGIVGVGLSDIFDIQQSSVRLSGRKDLSVSMGLFLQKTNIIRDYLEDILESPPRIFYPKEIWSLYVDNVASLKDKKYRTEALQCLNHMVTNALSHTIDCLEYLHELNSYNKEDIFTFCAVPQVMAIATLTKCYNNYAVFTSEVKIRKGVALKIMCTTSNFLQVRDWFNHFLKALENKVPSGDPNESRIKLMLSNLRGSKYLCA